jgi:hypothetical protein
MTLQLRLLLQAGQQHVPDITSRFIEEEAHSVASKMLRDDVKLNAGIELVIVNISCSQCLPVLVDHICDTPATIDDLTPTITVEVFRTQLTA